MAENNLPASHDLPNNSSKSLTERLFDLLERGLKRLFDTDNPEYLYLLIGSVVVWALGYGLFRPSFLDTLRNIEISRALITFLVAVTTVAIAILTALYAITSDKEKEDLKERIGYAKEILTTLVGILGTVLGFYFGSADQAGSQQIQLADAKFAPGDLMTHVAGGTNPFRYTITYSTQDSKSKVVTGLSTNGWIEEKLVPEPDKDDTITIEVTDSKDLRIVKEFKYMLVDTSTTEPTLANSPSGSQTSSPISPLQSSVSPTSN